MSNAAGCGCGCSTSSTSNETLTITAKPTEETMNEHNITLQVDGMTCGHCVSSVTEELTAVAGISKVEVDLTAGGTSTVTVTTSAPVAHAALEAAVAEAGYSLAVAAA